MTTLTRSRAGFATTLICTVTAVVGDVNSHLATRWLAWPIFGAAIGAAVWSEARHELRRSDDDASIASWQRRSAVLGHGEPWNR